jgi:hypothetical protein
MKKFNGFFSATKPPVDEQQLNEIELEMGIILPSSLRELYKLSNGCLLNQMQDIVHTMYFDNEPLGNFMCIYDLKRLKDIFLLTLKTAEADGFEDFGTNRFIPFSDIGRAFICIGHTGDDLGKIFWIDTGNPIDAGRYTILKLADSLEEFFDNLRPEEANG